MKLYHDYFSVIGKYFVCSFPIECSVFSKLAMQPEKLKKLGFTHILNAAEGRKFGQINTCATFYEDVGIKYLGFSIIDNPAYKIGMHFDEAIQFLEEALQDKKSKRLSLSLTKSLKSSFVL